ncbi:MAG TPA: hypothetical protein VH143_34700 [Kofleriaceae bacterium]|jgi:hypothetical protein|nr:hypothetical protein [Kofleriaceae bacterium]
MRWGLVVLLSAAPASASPLTLKCDDAATADLTIDGLLDDWHSQVLARVGTAPDGAVAFRCAWDGTTLALALDIADDRVVRVRGGRGHEDHVDVAIRAGGAAMKATIYPGTPIAPAKLVVPAKVEAADSLQPHGFSIELRVPASRIAGFSPSTPSFELGIVFHDSDQATGGKDTDIPLDATLELSDRSDLLGDFLRATNLKKSDLIADQMAELDPDRRGKERLVAGGTVIGVITDQFAYVSLPVPRASDVKAVKLLPLGPHGQQIISAVIRQSGSGGTRDLLMLWTVWSAQLQPLAQIEIRKEQGGKLLESTWAIRGNELVVTPKPAVGWTEASWNEQSADDADPIALPWDHIKGGTAYKLAGHEVTRRDLPPAKQR